jgi:tRNA-2-methylthio-N6-dimethylallyladenosine synthase
VAVGRSPYLQAVHADGAQQLIGQIVPVRITGAARNSLAASVELEAA